MGKKRNGVLPNAHFKKHWEKYVQTWYDQPGKKTKRRTIRKTKALAVSPRPVAGSLRPIVRCQTFKYNSKVRSGRGFTLDELKVTDKVNRTWSECSCMQAAGISRKLAPTIGIAVDPRRKNKSLESHQANVQRLKEYHSKLVLWPRKAGQPKQGDSDVCRV